MFNKYVKKGKTFVKKQYSDYKEGRKYDKETRVLAAEEAKKERRSQAIKTARFKESTSGKRARQEVKKDTGGFGFLSAITPPNESRSTVTRKRKGTKTKTKKRKARVVRREPEKRNRLPRPKDYDFDLGL